MVALYQKPRTSSDRNGIVTAPVRDPRPSRKLTSCPAPTMVVDAIVNTNRRTWSQTRSRNFTNDGETALNLPDILKVFAGLEANRAPGRDAHFFAGPWVAADAALARLHLKHAEAAQL